MNENKLNILEAAAKLFWKNGYNYTSMEDISKVSGSKKSNIFYHFDSKDTLLREVILYEIKNTEDAVKRILNDSSKTLNQRYEHILDLQYVLLEQGQGCLFGKLALETNGIGMISRLPIKDFFDLWKFYLKGIFNQKYDEETAKEKATQIIIGLQGATIVSIAQSDFSVLKKEVERLKDIL